MKLNDLTIRALQPPAKGAQIHYDETLPGFGIRISEGGTKSFVLTHGARRRRETIGRYGVITLQNARAEAKRRLAEYTLGKDRPRVLSWRSALDEYLSEVQSKRKPSTFKSYSRHLRKHFRFGDTRMTDITPHDLQQALGKLRDRPAEHFHAFTALRAFISWAHQKHYLDRNPMERMKQPEGSKPRSRILTDDELKRVWIAAGNDPFGKIVKLLILTGQRRGEIAQLTREMVQHDKIVLPSWLCKNSREHAFPLGTLAQATLPTAPPTGYLFPARGSDTAFNGWSTTKDALDKRSGITNWVLHDLRRTFASGLAAQGTALHVIERILNHVSGSFGGIVGVYQRYDFMPEMRAAIEKWEAHIQKLLQH
jgi:integrase